MRSVNVARVFVALKTPATVYGVLDQARTIVTEIEANPSIFTTPNPPLAILKTAITALDTAQTATLSRAAGTVQARDQKVYDLVALLHTAAAYVEDLANVDPTKAPTVIHAAGMAVRKAAVRTKQDLAVTQGAVSSSVILVAKAAGKRASYEWQYSLDQKVWTDLPATLQAHTSASSLAVGVMHHFRARAISKAGAGEWTQVVSMIVK